MLHQGPVRPALVHHDQVEPVLVAGPPVPIHPDHGHLSLGTALPETERLPWGAEPVGAPGLHFDERHLMTPANDQVHVMVTEPKPAVEDAPAVRSEEGDGRLFPFVAEDMAGVGPFADRFGLVS